MALNVLKVFRLLGVDITREVEIELVLLNLLEAHHLGVFCNFEPLIENIDDLMDVLRAQAVLGAVLHEA
jgi:hypothetical protein